MIIWQKKLQDWYDIKIKDIEKFSLGYTNKNYLITANNRKKYVARISPHYKKDHILLESYVLNAIKEHGFYFLIPEIMKNSCNDYFTDLGNKLLTIFYYIPGLHIDELTNKRLKKDYISSELGRLVGDLHNILYKINTPKTNFTHVELIKSYISNFNSYIPKQDSGWKSIIHKEINLIINEISKYKEYYEKIKYPQTFIHTDIRLDNIIFRNGKISSLLDFDDILIGDQAFDLSSMFIEVYANHDILSEQIIDLVNIEEFIKFINSYLKIRYIKNKKNFLSRVINLINLQALQVLYLASKPSFIEEKGNEREKNLIWYLNFIHAINKENNKRILKKEIIKKSSYY